MAQQAIQHFQNDIGVHEIRIGVKEFMCRGASDPHDHPHVYLDMGEDSQIVCPYCSTLFTYSPKIAANSSEPAGCLVGDVA